MTFLYVFSLACLAALLLTTGGGHGIGFLAFRALLREHEVLPIPLVTAAAGLLVCLELSLGLTALLLLAGNLSTTVAPALFAAGAGVGAMFWLYVRRLLRHATKPTRCGCTPLSSPLTPAAMLPAATLTLTSCAGLLVAGWARAPRALEVIQEYGSAAFAGAVLAGVVWTGITILVPASMPLPLTATKESDA